MSESSKGRQPDSLVTRTEAARLLGVPINLLKKLTSKGVLPTPKRRGNDYWYDLADLSIAAEVMEKKINMVSAYEMAVSAYAIAKRTERMVTELVELIGARYEPLSTDEKDVQKLYYKCRYVLNVPIDHVSVDDMLWLSKSFLGVDQNYLMVVLAYTKDPEPWRILLDAANHLIAQAPKLKVVTVERQQVLGYLAFARIQLRQASYFYCRTFVGKSEADRLFPEISSGTVTQTILSLLHPCQVGPP